MLNKMAILAVLVCLFCALVLAQAQEQQKKSGDPGISAWLHGLQKKLEQIVPRKSVPLRSGVGGLHGSREAPQVRLYWKGNKDDEAVTEGELMKFKSAVDAAAKDDRAGSVKGFEEFMKLYPDSALIPDAKKTLDIMRSEGKGEKK